MAWTDERIERLKALWEQGMTASQIAEDLGGVSRNAVIGKAHRLGLQARPSPVRPNEPAAPPAPVAAPEPVAEQPAVEADPIVEPEPEVEDEDEVETIEAADEDPDAEPAAKPVARPILAEFRPTPPPSPYPPSVPSGPTGAQLRSVGPGGFLRQGPGDQAPPAAPAPPRRLVPARPNADMASKTTLLDLTDKICKWPLGHPGEPDFHFCGDTVNPGFPYCVAHCGQAYQAQLPRRDRRGAPPLPFGGPRVR